MVDVSTFMLYAAIAIVLSYFLMKLLEWISNKNLASSERIPIETLVAIEKILKSPSSSLSEQQKRQLRSDLMTYVATCHSARNARKYIKLVSNRIGDDKHQLEKNSMQMIEERRKTGSVA